MNSEITNRDFTFHDTNLVRAGQEGSTLRLTIEYYTDDDNKVIAITLISGIDRIYRDDVVIESFKMETEEGEIYRLTKGSSEIVLIIFWDTYLPHSRTMRTYRLLGSNIQVQIRPE